MRTHPDMILDPLADAPKAEYILPEPKGNLKIDLAVQRQCCPLCNQPIAYTPRPYIESNCLLFRNNIARLQPLQSAYLQVMIDHWPNPTHQNIIREHRIGSLESFKVIISNIRRRLKQYVPELELYRIDHSYGLRPMKD